MKKSIVFEPTTEVIIRAYSSMELARLYRVDYRTFLKWIKPFREELGQKHGRLFTIPQVKLIFEKLDYPNFPVVKQVENNEKE